MLPLNLKSLSSLFNLDTRAKRRAAFTVVELLIVLAILFVLIALLLPTFTASRDQARFVRWAAYSKNLQASTSSFLYYAMQQPEQGGKIFNDAGGNPHLMATRGASTPDVFYATLMESETAEHSDPKAMWTEGRWKSKAALKFNGTNEWARVRFHKDAMLKNGRWTFFASVKIDAADEHDGLICLGTNKTEKGPWLFRLGSTGGKPNFNVLTNHGLPGTSGSYSSGTFTVGEWALGVVTYNGNVIRSYVNGKETATYSVANLAFSPSQDDISIGCDFPSGDEYLGGTLDELGVFRGAMSDTDVLQMAEVGARRTRE